MVVQHYIHSLSPAAHDVGQNHTEDQNQSQGNDDGHHVVGEEVSVRRRLRRTELSSPGQDPGARGRGRSRRNRLGQMQLCGWRMCEVKFSI